MAFGARTEKGKWYLCHRKGITIHGTTASGAWEPFVFKNQKAAKACADELNEKFWTEYDKAWKRKAFPDCGFEMLETIRRYL